MVLVRRIDTEATALQRQGELGIWAPLLGQEAAQIGAGRALRPQDMAFPTYREHGVAWCRGVDPLELLGLFRGVDQGGWDPAATTSTSTRSSSAPRRLHATGYAMGMQRDGVVGPATPTATAVIAHFGDGATSQGDVNEALHLRRVYNAPVVFFCQNNQWAISEPIERQTRIPLYQRARLRLPRHPGRRQRRARAYAVTRWALEERRDGQGPTFVEAYTYRMGAHTTTDDPTRYRLSDDVERWRLKDPIERVRAYLVSATAWPTRTSSTRSRPRPTSSAPGCARRAWRCRRPVAAERIFDHVYAEMTPELEEQREASRRTSTSRSRGSLR